jgi:3-hydroxyisobutyrate dehydrogenase
MGLPMAQRLMQTDTLSLTVYNRTSDKLEPLRHTGATIASSVTEVLQSSEAILLMLTDAAAIREVLLTESVQAQLSDRTIIQMGTIAPSDSRSWHDEIVGCGGHYLEAPVLGSIPEARAGTLLVMVGATPDQFQHWLPLFHQLGQAPLLIGEVGTAAALKLALNQLISSLTAAFALSLSFIQHQGVAVETFMQVLRQSALYAPTFDNWTVRSS